jgi:hypothetical protein
MKRFDCVYAKNKLDFKKYSRCNSYKEVISFHDIIAKLIKNDIDGIKPSDYVVNSYIRKKIIKALSDSNEILYALKNLDSETIESLKALILENNDGDICFNLIVIDSKKTKNDIEEDIQIKFNGIFFIEND